MSLVATDRPAAWRTDIAAVPSPTALRVGCGVGLKPQHYGDALGGRHQLAFFEFHAQNYMVEGGPYNHYLRQVRERYALSLHGVGLSLGGQEPLDEAHLDRLAALVDRYQPAAFSEHLTWSSHGGMFLNDLLPPAGSEQCVRVMREPR